jgi:hypothetical protein
VTVPEIEVVPCLNVNVEAVIVEGSIASLNVARIFELIGVPVAKSSGDVDVTVGVDADGDGSLTM